MNTSSPVDAFLRYSCEQRIAFLSRLAHELTIVARDTYEVGTERVRNAPRLRTLNEIQHRLLASLVALLNDDPRRYPDEMLAALLVDGGEDQELEDQLKEAFARVASTLVRFSERNSS